MLPPHFTAAFQREIESGAPELERYGLVEFVIPRDDVHAKMHWLAEIIAGNGHWPHEQPSAL
jgi:hypothetical protein